MGRFNKDDAVLLLSVFVLYGCGDLGTWFQRYVESTRPQVSTVRDLGFVAGLGTTFAAVPDLIGMLKRRSSRA